jgi:nucleotide-binding universal stress UspA family protein
MDTLKILIPTDFSVQAEYAFLLVKRLEEKLPMEVHFLHIMNVPDTVSMDENGNIQTCGEIDVKYVEKQRDIAVRQMLALQNQYGPEIKTHIRMGKTTDGILDFSEKEKVDLIVMGTKGAWGLKEKLSGTETQMIARKSRIPLLSMMCDRSDLKIENLLLVHDFQKPEVLDLKLLKMLTQAFGCKLHLLQITTGNSSAQKEEFEVNTRNFAEMNGISKYESHLVSDTDVENGVIHFNQMMNMDIICIGTHGKPRLLHQSATEKLINHLFKPIISFHIS